MQNKGYSNNGHNNANNNSRPVSSTNDHLGGTSYQKTQQQNAYFQQQQQQPYGLSTNQFINNNNTVVTNNNNNMSGNTMMMRQQPQQHPQYPHTITNSNQTIQYHQPPQSQMMSSQKPYPPQTYSTTSIDNTVTKRGWHKLIPFWAPHTSMTHFLHNYLLFILSFVDTFHKLWRIKSNNCILIFS